MVGREAGLSLSLTEDALDRYGWKPAGSTALFERAFAEGTYTQVRLLSWLVFQLIGFISVPLVCGNGVACI